MKLYLEYEGLHSICCNCGKYGHRDAQCRDFAETSMQEPLQKSTDLAVKEIPPSTDPYPNRDSSATAPQSLASSTVNYDNFESLDMGPWNLVQGKAQRKFGNRMTHRLQNKDAATGPSQAMVVWGEMTIATVPDRDKSVANRIDPEIEEGKQTRVAMVEKGDDRGPHMVTRIHNPLAGKNPQTGLRPKHSEPNPTVKQSIQKPVLGPTLKRPTQTYFKVDTKKGLVKEPEVGCSKDGPEKLVVDRRVTQEEQQILDIMKKKEKEQDSILFHHVIINRLPPSLSGFHTSSSELEKGNGTSVSQQTTTLSL